MIIIKDTIWRMRFVGIFAKLSVCLFLSVCSVSVQAAAAKFLFVRGEVEVVSTDKTTKAARKGMTLQAQDTISTGAKGYAQLRFSDGNRLVVRANTRLALAAYRYQGEKAVGNKLELDLKKGSFRSVTGKIGRQQPQNYLVKTTVGIIGVRGTDHEPTYIPLPAAGETPSAEPGLYDKVNQGETILQNAHGSITVGVNQAGYIAAGALPVILPAIPDFYAISPSRPAGHLPRRQAPRQAEDRQKQEDAPMPEEALLETEITTGIETGEGTADALANPIPEASPGGENLSSPPTPQITAPPPQTPQVTAPPPPLPMPQGFGGETFSDPLAGTPLGGWQDEAAEPPAPTAPFTPAPPPVKTPVEEPPADEEQPEQPPPPVGEEPQPEPPADNEQPEQPPPPVGEEPQPEAPADDEQPEQPPAEEPPADDEQPEQSPAPVGEEPQPEAPADDEQPEQPPAEEPPADDEQPQPEQPATGESPPPREEDVVPSEEPPPREEDVVSDEEPPPREEDVVSDEEPPPREEDVVPNEEPPPREEDIVPNEEPPPREEDIVPNEEPPPREEDIVPNEEPPPQEDVVPNEEPPREDVVPGEEPPPREEDIVPSEEPPPREDVVPGEEPPPREDVVPSEEPPSREDIVPNEEPPPREEDVVPSEEPPPREEDVVPSEEPPPREETVQTVTPPPLEITNDPASKLRRKMVLGDPTLAAAGERMNRLAATHRLDDSGTDAATGIRWGRWSSLAGGDDPAEIHWMTGPPLDIPPALPRTGTYHYTFRGGTRPTDNLGNTGQVNAAGLEVDFTHATVDANLNLSVGETTLDVNAQAMPIVEQGFAAGDGHAVPLTIQCPTCNGTPGGELAGRFTGAQGEGAISGYRLQNGHQEIMGTAAFGRE